jgi:phosphoglycerate dehydrogenase-like enzyme
MQVALPPDALRDELGPLPGEVELVTVGDDLAAAAGAEVAVLDGPLAARAGELLAAAPRLRVVQTLSAGVDWVPPVPDGVVLCSASGVHDIPVAEWVAAVILAMERRLPEFLALQARGEWDAEFNPISAGGGRDALVAPVDDLDGRRALIVGLGSIGRAAQARLEAFGMTVEGVARRARDGRLGPEALPELVPRADVVVLLVPLTPETERLVDGAFLDRMKPGALLVNAARGRVVDTDALLERLRAGRIRAALDVTDPEPLPPDHPLWRAPGVLITPHVAGTTVRWERRAWRFVGDQLRRLAAGEPLRNATSGR